MFARLAPPWGIQEARVESGWQRPRWARRMRSDAERCVSRATNGGPSWRRRLLPSSSGCRRNRSMYEQHVANFVNIARETGHHRSNWARTARDLARRIPDPLTSANTVRIPKLANIAQMKRDFVVRADRGGLWAGPSPRCSQTKVLVAAIRSAGQMVELAKAGLDAFTFSPKADAGGKRGDSRDGGGAGQRMGKVLRHHELVGPAPQSSGA